MHHTQRCFLASGCSTYRKYALRAPRVENPTGRGTSPPSQRQPDSGSGSRPRPGSGWEGPAIGRPLVGLGREGGRVDGSNPVRYAG